MLKLFSMRRSVMVSPSQESYRRVLGVTKRRIGYVKFTQLIFGELIFKELRKVTRVDIYHHSESYHYSILRL
jgi:hypothetical protein